MNRDIPFGRPDFGSQARNDYIDALYRGVQDWLQLPFGTLATQFLRYDPTSSRRLVWDVPAGGEGGGCDCDAEVADLQAQIDALTAALAAVSPGGGVVLVGAPDYVNDGGQGDRRSFITVTTNTTINFGGGEDAQCLVDGNLSNSMYFGTGQAATGKYIEFDLGAPALVNEARFYNGGGYSGPYGTWQWQATNDGTTFRLFPAFSWSPAPTGGWTILPGLETNTLGYSKYKLVGLGGTLNSANSLGDFEFQIYGL